MVDLPMADFFQPWTAYEESSIKLDELTSRAQVFTPFLLVAADARDKVKKGDAVTLQ